MSLPPPVRCIVLFRFYKQDSTTVEIHHQLFWVCGNNIMSNRNMRDWCTNIRGGGHVHNEEENGKSWTGCTLQCWFRISKLSYEFLQILKTTPCGIVTDRLSFHKFCAEWYWNWQSQNSKKAHDFEFSWTVQQRRE